MLSSAWLSYQRARQKIFGKKWTALSLSKVSYLIWRAIKNIWEGVTPSKIWMNIKWPELFKKVWQCNIGLRMSCQYIQTDTTISRQCGDRHAVTVILESKQDSVLWFHLCNISTVLSFLTIFAHYDVIVVVRLKRCTKIPFINKCVWFCKEPFPLAFLFLPPPQKTQPLTYNTEYL